MNISGVITDKVQSTVPIERQIQGAHLYDKARRWVTRTNGQKIFSETPIPPVEDVDLLDIDMSNPFLYRQGRWQSYFERLRNEAPVHFQPNSPFGPFWSVTRHADIVTVDKNHETFSAEPFIVICPASLHGPGDVHRDGSARTRQAARRRPRSGRAEEPA